MISMEKLKYILIVILLSGCNSTTNNSIDNINGTCRITIDNVESIIYRNKVKYSIEMKDVDKGNSFKLTYYMNGKNIRRDNFVYYLIAVGTNIIGPDTITADFSNYTITNN